MTPSQKAWIKLICIVIATGSSVTVTSYLGGAKLWIAILCGLGTGVSNVLHALDDSPTHTGNTTFITKSDTKTETTKP